MNLPVAEILDTLIPRLRAIIHDLLGQNGLLLGKTPLLRRGLHEQEITGLGNAFRQTKLMPGLLLLIGTLTQSRNQRKKSLITTGTLCVGLLAPKLGHRKIVLPDVECRNHLVSLPDLLIPTTPLNTTLLPFNGFIGLAHILQSLSQLEHVANIVGFLLETLGQQPNIAILLIGLGTPIANIVNPDSLHGIALTAIPLLVCDTHALPRHRQLHKPSVLILESSVLLNNAISTGSLELGMGILTLENHVTIQHHGLRLLEIPAQFLRLLLGRRKRQTPIVSKILPFVLDDLCGTIREGLGNLASVIGGSCIADDDGIGVTRSGLQATLEDLALILHHEGEQNVGHSYVGSGCHSVDSYEERLKDALRQRNPSRFRGEDS